MLCKECKKEIRDDAEFCKYCGWKVEKDSEVSFCTSCGKQIKNDSLFCKHCGVSVNNVMPVSKKDDKHNKRNLAMKLVLIALLVIACFSLFPRDKAQHGKQIDETPYNGKSKPEINSGYPEIKSSDNSDCFVCGGDGKKDCTSCDGGYITEYDTGTYMGYGSTTREVRKKCMVCKGSGEVKCYH